MILKEIKVKSILSRSKVYEYTINPYVGCQFGCVYCYAQFMKNYTGHNEKWGDFVDVKINSAILLEREIKKKKRGVVWISGVCDPYQPVERKYGLTRRILEILSKENWSVVVQTKSPLVLRDIDIFKKFKNIEIGFSIGTADENIRKLFEPRTASIEKRIEALKRLKEEGLRTYCMVAPLLPGAFDLPQKLKGSVDYVVIDKMNYHYADHIYKKYGLKKDVNINLLIDLFKKEKIKTYLVK